MIMREKDLRNHINEVPTECGGRVHVIPDFE